jgi:GNAT superfamily N-acetyltransferase
MPVSFRREELLVRQALLKDAQGITQVYRSLISRWTAINTDGSRVEAEYDDLSLYQRWQHGGAWLSVETCSVWTGHLLQHSDGIPLVVEQDGEIVGHAEVFIAHEADPYGEHINISTLCVRQDVQHQGIGRALVTYIEEMAQVLGCRQVTAAYAEPAAFWIKIGFEPLQARQRIRLPAMEGRVFYKARDLNEDTPDQIRGWFMPLGRFQNAREEWERMYWLMWNGVPELVEAQWHRLFIDLTGQPSILHLHQHDDDPATVTARLWTKYAPTSHIISAVRDRAARLGYQQITTLVDANLRPTLTDAIDEEDIHWLYTRILRS